MIDTLTLNKSVLLRRIILLLLSAVLLSGLLSAGIYIFVSQRIYADIRAKELMPIAKMVAEMLTDIQQNDSYGRGIESLLNGGNRSFGATLHVYNAQGESIMNQVGGGMRQGGKAGNGSKNNNSEMSEADTLTLISADLKNVLAGNEISEVRKSADGESYLVVGIPIENGDTVIGTVFFTKAMEELRDTMNGLNATLIISTIIAFFIMLIPAYYLTRRLVIPIRQMQNVARAMAGGDFSIRADESIKGEIGELSASMNHFAVASEQLEQTRKDYVANVSHELRTPIASIRAMGETLRDGMVKTDEKQQLFFNNIVRESLRLSRLVDDLLELSRLQAGTEAMQKSRFDLREVVQNISDGYGHFATDADLEFEVNADMSTPIYVHSNSDRIEQVLVALMDNAIKYTPDQGKITLSLGNVNGKITICVLNTCEAIPAEDLPFIFERFYKVDKSHSDSGTGLGLSIAKEIIRGLGEKIWAENYEGSTKFIFTVSP